MSVKVNPSINSVYVQDVFTSSGTWYKPVGVTKVDVFILNGGGGGGAGGVQTSTSTQVGGGNGGGGGAAVYTFGLDVTSVNSVAITVGAGGAGGTAAATNATTTAAQNGSAGGLSAFGNILYFGNSKGGGGAGGAGESGTISAGNVGTSGVVVGDDNLFMNYADSNSGVALNFNVNTFSWTLPSTPNPSVSTIGGNLYALTPAASSSPTSGTATGGDSLLANSINPILRLPNFYLSPSLFTAGSTGGISTGTPASTTEIGAGGLAGIMAGGGRGGALTGANAIDTNTYRVNRGGKGGAGGGGAAGGSSGSGGNAAPNSGAGGGGGGASRTVSQGAGGNGGAGLVIVGYYKNL